MFWGIFIFAVVVGLLLFKLTVESILRALQIAPKHIMHFQLYYALFLVITIGIIVYTLLRDISNLLISFSVQPTRVASTETNRAEYANVTDTIDWATADARATTDAIARATANTRAATDAYAGATADARATTNAIIRATTDARATDDAKTRAITDARSTTDAFAKTEADNELNNTPTPCPSIANPYGLERLQLQKLGCVAQDWVPSRLIVTQRFEQGFMIVFDDPSNSDFKKPNQQRRIYALADDGRVWRVYFDSDDVIQNTSPNPDDWYTCEGKPGLRPKDSGVPWRGFGRAWCIYPQIRQGIGRVQPGSDEIKGTVSFQSYFTGRVFQINGEAYAYIVYLDADDSTIDNQFLTGTWKQRPAQTSIPSVQPSVQQPSTSGSSQVYFRVSQSLQICNDTRGQVWFEGTVNINGQPRNGYKVVFKSTKVPGNEPVTAPAITGPHDNYANWETGYYSHIVDASSSQAKDKSLQIWIINDSGNKISDYAYWQTEGASGSCNKAVINFDSP